jgi:serine/threonine protein phosphatase PrpC
MEDAHIVSPTATVSSDGTTISLFGVFDGHGGIVLHFVLIF